MDYLQPSLTALNSEGDVVVPDISDKEAYGRDYAQVPRRKAYRINPMPHRSDFSLTSRIMLRKANTIRQNGLCLVMSAMGRVVPVGQHGEVHHIYHRDNNRVDAGIYLSKQGHRLYHQLPPFHQHKRILDQMMSEHSAWVADNIDMLTRLTSPLLLSFS